MRHVTTPSRLPGLCLTLLLGAGLTPGLAATGSWVASVPGRMVAMSDRTSATQAAVPPASADVAGRVMGRVQWRFATPPGRLVDAWLCHPQDCLSLTQRRGTTRAFAGYPADAPLEFRFRLPPGESPFRVKESTVIVNYQ